MIYVAFSYIFLLSCSSLKMLFFVCQSFFFCKTFSVTKKKNQTFSEPANIFPFMIPDLWLFFYSKCLIILSKCFALK